MELSRYFVDERGQKPYYFDQEAIERGADPAKFWASSPEYNQSHLPVREQPEVVGHAVRAVYLYSAMADLAGEYGDAGLLAACRRLWTHLTTKRMYVMGGIGTSAKNEGFTSDYDLPNESAYAETCAAIGLIFWAQRMLQIDLDRRYADVLELALYNAVISGVSLDGEAFFYDNPLASDGKHHRQGWFSCPCCPPNLARLLASLGDYIYAQSDTDAVVHLYVQGAGQFQLGGQNVTLSQETRYPWDGAVALRVAAEQPARFGLRLRLPGWCAAPRLAVNGTPVELAGVSKTATRGSSASGRMATWSRSTCRCRPSACTPTRRSPPTPAMWRSSAGRWCTAWSRPIRMCRSTGWRCCRRPSWPRASSRSCWAAWSRWPAQPRRSTMPAGRACCIAQPRRPRSPARSPRSHTTPGIIARRAACACGCARRSSGGSKSTRAHEGPRNGNFRGPAWKYTTSSFNVLVRCAALTYDRSAGSGDDTQPP